MLPDVDLRCHIPFEVVEIGGLSLHLLSSSKLSRELDGGEVTDLANADVTKVVDVVFGGALPVCAPPFDAL